MVYQIKIKGNLDQSWSDWLGNVQMMKEIAGDGSAITTLTLETNDQPSLFGILDRIRDLNLILIHVTCQDDEA